jgi:hypothetical protein
MAAREAAGQPVAAEWFTLVSRLCGGGREGVSTQPAKAAAVDMRVPGRRWAHLECGGGVAGGQQHGAHGCEGGRVQAAIGAASVRQQVARHLAGREARGRHVRAHALHHTRVGVRR